MRHSACLLCGFWASKSFHDMHVASSLLPLLSSGRSLWYLVLQQSSCNYEGKAHSMMSCKPGPRVVVFRLLLYKKLCKKKKILYLFKPLRSCYLVLAAKIFLNDTMDKSDSFVFRNPWCTKVIEAHTVLCPCYYQRFQLSIISNFGEDEEDTILLPRGSLQLNRA